MKFAIDVPNHGPYGDPNLLLELAGEAEAAGWDGFFMWDHLVRRTDPRLPLVDPWVALAAIAARTERIRLGPMVTPLARRRPWKVARETASLDHLSGGRLILGVGLGSADQAEFAAFGDAGERKVRAEMLDEGLDILAGLWQGQPFQYQGRHYRLQETLFLPPPVQSPRIPIWVAGTWPNRPPFRRAARWDGVFVQRAGQSQTEMMSPDEIREARAYIGQFRQAETPFDIAHAGLLPGHSPAEDAAIAASYAAAGVTWWLENITPDRGPLAAMKARIRQGPPRQVE